MRCRALFAVAVALSAAVRGAPAAHMDGDCCADLEIRIAELEAAMVRKGNRKVSLTVQGQVNKAVLFWYDGAESNGYVVGNKNDQSNIAFLGDAQIAYGWKAGYDITLRLRDDLSDDVDQGHDNGTGKPFEVWQAHWWIESEQLGKLAVGKASRVTDTAPENDLSESGVAGYAGVQDMGGAFRMRAAGGVLLNVTWGDVYNHLNGDTANVVRYDTPAFGGFIASASWGEDDIWDVGLRYDAEGSGFTVSAAIAYAEISDAPGEFAGLDQSTAVGSLAVRHEATGLNALVSLGRREFDKAEMDADGVMRTPDDATSIYAKAGWLAKLNVLGPTAFYGEYGWFKDFVPAGDQAGVAGGDLAGNLGAAGMTGNKAQVWGAGVVQHIEDAEMQVYLGYRWHEAGFDLVDDKGAAIAGPRIEDLHTLVAGSKIAF